MKYPLSKLEKRIMAVVGTLIALYVAAVVITALR